MPAYKIGRLWKLKRDEVDKWVKSGGTADTENESTNNNIRGVVIFI